METLYFIANATMPGLLKIGHTSGPVEERLRQLNTTGVPQPFYVVATFIVRNAAECERKIHEQLAHARQNKNREFFKISPERALTEVIPIIAKFLDSAGMRVQSQEQLSHPLDKDDIFFLQAILHKDQELISCERLAEEHSGYSPLELEYKLLKLADEGLIKRIEYRGDSGSWWKMTPEGVKFMFEKGHVLRDLIEEARKK